MTLRERLMRAVLALKWSRTTISRIMKAKTSRHIYYQEREDAVQVVDALLRALREPTEEQLAAGIKANSDVTAMVSLSCLTTTSWQAMIDVLLEGPDGC